MSSITSFHFFYICFIYFIIFPISTNAENLSHLEDILNLEEIRIHSLESIIDLQEHQLRYLRQQINILKDKHIEAKFDPKSYLTNPINVFSLIKRQTNDWQEIEERLSVNFVNDILNQLKVMYNTSNTLHVPDENDLNQAAIAIQRLQKVYEINTTEIVNGILNGITYNAKMSADDCYELGVQLHKSENYHHAILWLNEALIQVKNGSYRENLEENINGYLAMAYIGNGNLTTALSIIKNISQNNPESEFAEIENAIEMEMEKQKSDLTQQKSPIKEDTENLDLLNVIKEYDNQQYVQLCRNKSSPNRRTNLHCRYVTNKNPFLRIAPLKLEEYSIDPYLVMYHDVLYETEMNQLRMVSQSDFHRDIVQFENSELQQISIYQASRSAFISDEYYFMKLLNGRIADMTNLSLKTSTNMQLINYDIGGHYNPRVDFPLNQDPSNVLDNCIATLLFYMTDVENGGETVFPFLNVAVTPKKGSALFWYNLYDSGAPDYRLRYAECPIIVGNKLVAKKWIRSKDQMSEPICELKETVESNSFFVPGIGSIENLILLDLHLL